MTDADVDGSHIRTLLLTFFYRHMREVIDRGYLYIAQPPLYKVKRGSSELYLKNEKALQEYLINAASTDAKLETADGRTIEGKELVDLVDEAAKLVAARDQVARKMQKGIAEGLAITGAINADLFEESKCDDLTKTALTKLITPQPEPDKTAWTAALNGEKVEFSRLVRGIKELHILHRAQVDAPEFMQLARRASALQSAFKGVAKLTIKGVTTNINLPSELLDIVIEAGKKGLGIQRFKGLGEMNSEQLWETTLNPETRRLLQVKVGETDDAEEVFSTLMGSVVEPRRDFIQSNALNVVNLDV